MSLMPTPIATFLSTYGQGLANFFNISSKIPLMCAVNPDGTALGGPGTVGDEDFITNFSAAGGGGDLSKAFDLSGPIPLVCMVNPDGTAYSPVPYTEISFTWTQTGTDDPVVAAINTAPDGLTITPAYEDPGFFNFTFPANTFPVDAETKRVEITGTQVITTPMRFISYDIPGATYITVKVKDSTFADANDVYLPSGAPVTTIIRIFPA